ncbi:hypothetical protein PG994_001963 [Apiospora phragmitis]|uniref:Zn(2)-C6 fungal-type domain-containing protein n=1 Tax=Apiospora phragmitis TaxID=2905665 RepID=A0ABR1WV23_9PEZI
MSRSFSSDTGTGERMEPSEVSTLATLDFLDVANQAAAAAGSGCESSINYSNVLIDDVVEDVVSNSTSTSNNSWSARQAAKKQRLERQGHTKSRRGCYNCKRRRIKCPETYPSCGHCTKAGLNCEYPAMPQVTHQPQHRIPLFSLQDMRFVQHFLLNCVPHHPLGNEAIWTHEMACLSQNVKYSPQSSCQHEYLMHAMLGLAASDLLGKDASLLPFAIAHRIKAIKAIKKTLNDVPKNNMFEEGNALVATCFALTFQSVLLDDGMTEFMTFCRGVVLVATQMYCKGAKFLFTNWVG